MMNETTYTFDEDSISDLHKDAMGFRPSQSFWEFWETATDDEKQAEWDSLIAYLERNMAEEEKHQKECITAFEKHVVNTICMGARDRETALRWIMDASDCDGDWEYLAYRNGLPFGYFKNKV